MNHLMIIGIMMLVLLGILVGIGFYAYHAVRKKVRSVSKMLFGTNSLSQGIGQIEAEYATTPKSVSAATSLYLPRIVKDFPDFHYEEMKNRAENVLISYLRSIDENNPDLLTEGTEELREQLSMYLGMLEADGVREHYDRIKLHRTEIYQYRKQSGRCGIVFQSAIEFYYYKTKNGEVKEGSQNTKKQAKFNVECIYIQDRDMVENQQDAALGVNCPNCGAPLSGLGAKVCPYCDTPVVELNIRSWNFSKVDSV